MNRNLSMSRSIARPLSPGRSVGISFRAGALPRGQAPGKIGEMASRMSDDPRTGGKQMPADDGYRFK
jgi:hypothetical protein